MKFLYNVLAAFLAFLLLLFISRFSGYQFLPFRSWRLSANTTFFGGIVMFCFKVYPLHNFFEGFLNYRE